MKILIHSNIYSNDVHILCPPKDLQKSLDMIVEIQKTNDDIEIVLLPTVTDRIFEAEAWEKRE